MNTTLKPQARAVRAAGACARILLVSAVAASFGCARYKWKVADAAVYASEAGRVRKFTEVEILDTKRWVGWSDHLVELTEYPSDDVPPTWPTHKDQIDQHLLSWLDWRTPGYRRPYALLRAAENKNRDVGAFRDAWVVGTKPFAVAYLHPGATTASTLPSNVGVEILRNDYGIKTTLDKRQRFPHVIRDADLNQLANVLLLYPPELELTEWSSFCPDPTTQPALTVAVFTFNRPMPLRQMMQMVADGSARSAAQSTASLRVDAW